MIALGSFQAAMYLRYVLNPVRHHNLRAWCVLGIRQISRTQATAAKATVASILRHRSLYNTRSRESIVRARTHSRLIDYGGVYVFGQMVEGKDKRWKGGMVSGQLRETGHRQTRELSSWIWLGTFGQFVIHSARGWILTCSTFFVDITTTVNYMYPSICDLYLAGLQTLPDPHTLKDAQE